MKESDMKKQTTMMSMVLPIAALLLTACGSNKSSFSLLPAGQAFKQSNSSTSNKVDLLWVIDNSRSMSPSQNNILNNISAFTTNFQSKNLNYKLAVTTTEAYLAGPNFANNASYSKFRDGSTLYNVNPDGSYGSVSYNQHTGIFVIIPTVLNLIQTFSTNAYQGDQGSGDERAFKSIQRALEDSQNAGFHRSDAYLAVIILSDEDDFSGDNRVEGSWIGQLPGETNAQYAARYVPDHSYSAPTLDTVDSYVSYLDTVTASTPANRHYNVSSIAVLDNACLTSHKAAGSPDSVIGQRYIDLATKTNGSLGSLCDTNFSATLTNIQEKILELSSQFFLSRTPRVETISVVVNNATISNDAANGWTYNSTTNSIVFHGASIPVEGANIAINFDPTTIK
jgi:hypothetical protein